MAHRANETFRNKSTIEAEILEIPELPTSKSRLLLVKPQTFMNVVGRSLRAIMTKYPVSAGDVLVVYDDADLEFGDVRFKTGGSSAGHRGMDSVLSVFPRGTSISRLRVGIGRPSHPDIPLEDFVLQKWTKSEIDQLPRIIDLAVKTIESEWV